MNIEYRDLNLRPLRNGGKRRHLRVATEVRPIGVVGIGNRKLWTGTISVIVPERKARGLK